MSYFANQLVSLLVSQCVSIFKTHKRYFQYEDPLKNEDNLQIEDNLKNEVELKNDDDVRNKEVVLCRKIPHQAHTT